MLFVLFVVPCMFTAVVAVLVAYFIYPAYDEQDKDGRLLIALFTPLISVFLKGISRICVQRLWKISHPGTSFVLLSPLYCGIAKAFTSGSKQFRIRCADWTNPWHC